MNTAPTPTLAAFTPEQINTMSPDMRSTFARQLIAAGHDRQLVDKTFGITALTPVISGQKSDTPPSVAEREKISRVDYLKRHWTGDPAALETALKQEGVELVPVGSDPRTSVEQAFDAGFPKTDKSDYKLYYGRDMGDPAEVATIHDATTAAFAAMQLPTQAAQGLLDAMIRSADEYNALKDGFERRQYGEKQNQLVEKLGKDIGDKVEIAKLAALALKKADKDFVKKLAEKGRLESAAVIIQLARQGQRLAYREQLAAKRR